MACRCTDEFPSIRPFRKLVSDSRLGVVLLQAPRVRVSHELACVRPCGRAEHVGVPVRVTPGCVSLRSSGPARNRTRLHADAQAAERAGFEPAEEREPLAGLANRCLGPLDYLSRAAFYRVEMKRATAIRHPLRVRALHELARVCEATGLRSGRDSNPRGLVGLPVFKTGGFVRSPTPPDSDYTWQCGGIRICASLSRSFRRRANGLRRTAQPTAPE